MRNFVSQVLHYLWCYYCKRKRMVFFNKLNAFLHSEFHDPRNLIQVSWGKKPQLTSLRTRSRQANTNTPEQAQQTAGFPLKQQGWKKSATTTWNSSGMDAEPSGFNSSFFRCHSFLSQDMTVIPQTLTHARHMFRGITRSKEGDYNTRDSSQTCPLEILKASSVAIPVQQEQEMYAPKNKSIV